MKARVSFGKRTSLAPDAAEMIVPIGIFAADEGEHFTIDRTRHYLVDEFDRMYCGRLHTLPAWLAATYVELRSEAQGLHDEER